MEPTRDNLVDNSVRIPSSYKAPAPAHTSRLDREENVHLLGKLLISSGVIGLITTGSVAIFFVASPLTIGGGFFLSCISIIKGVGYYSTRIFWNDPEFRQRRLEEIMKIVFDENLTYPQIIQRYTLEKEQGILADKHLDRYFSSEILKSASFEEFIQKNQTETISFIEFACRLKPSASEAPSTSAYVNLRNKFIETARSYFSREDATFNEFKLKYADAVYYFSFPRDLEEKSIVITKMKRDLERANGYSDFMRKHSEGIFSLDKRSMDLELKSALIKLLFRSLDQHSAFLDYAKIFEFLKLPKSLYEFHINLLKLINKKIDYDSFRNSFESNDLFAHQLKIYQSLDLPESKKLEGIIENELTTKASENGIGALEKSHAKEIEYMRQKLGASFTFIEDALQAELDRFQTDLNFEKFYKRNGDINLAKACEKPENKEALRKGYYQMSWKQMNSYSVSTQLNIDSKTICTYIMEYLETVEKYKGFTQFIKRFGVEVLEMDANERQVIFRQKVGKIFIQELFYFQTSSPNLNLIDLLKYFPLLPILLQHSFVTLNLLPILEPVKRHLATSLGLFAPGIKCQACEIIQTYMAQLPQKFQTAIIDFRRQIQEMPKEFEDILLCESSTPTRKSQKRIAFEKKLRRFFGSKNTPAFVL